MKNSSSLSSRQLSLDVLRGMTLLLMIVVNTPGDWGNIYSPFKHAPWHGCTLTDLVFPAFLFIVGNSMSYSLGKYSNSSGKFFKKIFKRSVIIFSIGILLGYYPGFLYQNGDFIFKDPGELRVWGVLQRIALCYLLAGTILFYVRDRFLILTSGMILLAYWAILYVFGDSGIPYSLEGNAVAKLDLWLLNEQNLYQHFGRPFDPEGLLSTFPAVVNVLAGYMAGRFIQKNGTRLETAQKIYVWGLGLIALGLFWNLLLPINKPIWTSSYSIYSIGWILIALSLLLYLIDIRNNKGWTYFFEVFGKNTLFIYILSGALIKTFRLFIIEGSPATSYVYQHLFSNWLPAKTASLCYALAYMLLLWLIAYVMDKRKVYIKV